MGNYREEPEESLPGTEPPAAQQTVDSTAQPYEEKPQAIPPREAPTRAIGGGVIPAPARSAGATIDMLEDGQLSADLQAELLEVVAQMRAVHNSTGSKVKGEAVLTLKLEMDDEGGMVRVEGKIKTKMPDLPRKRSIMWQGDDGSSFTRFPPNQLQAFGTAPIRRIG